MIPEFHYRIDWRSSRVQPGYHRSLHTGGGYEFQGYIPLHQTANPRHLDLRASLRDPHGQLQVRSFRQSSAISVYLLADVSASMQSAGKLDTLADFADSLAWSALRTGDAFGLLAADESVRPELCIPCGHQIAGITEWRQRANRIMPTGRSAQGLIHLAAHTGLHRSLIFLLSDFHFPLAHIETLRQSLALHDVVPVVLWEASGYEAWPDYRFIDWQDPETLEHRRYWMRPSLKARFRTAYAQRRQQLIKLFTAWGRSPLFLSEGFNADTVTAYFHQGVTA